MNDTIRWGIIGPGKIANKFAAALKNSHGARLQAVGSRSLERAEIFAANYGAPRVHGDYESLAADPEIDAVYIATPHSAHLEDILRCLHHGKAVLCEKPFTINATEARQAIEAARAAKCFLMEAMWTRFLPALHATRSWLREGEIGEVRLLNAAFGFQAPYHPEARLFNPAVGGGALLDVGVYCVSLASMVFGAAPLEISGHATFGETGVDEEFSISLRYPGDRLATMTCSVRTRLPGGAQIIGSKGWLSLPQFWKADFIRRRHGEAEETFRLPYLGAGFEHEIAEVGHCLREGKLESETMPLDETLTIMETLDRIRKIWGLKYPMEQTP